MRNMLILLMTVLFATGLVGAQEVTPTFCGDLSDADCAILTESAEAMRQLESAAFRFQLDFEIGDFPEMRPGTVGFQLTGHGAYAIEPGVLNLMTLSPQEMMESFSGLTQLTEDVLKGISGDVTLLLFFPANLRQAAAREGGNLPGKAGLSLRLVDGVGYINLDKLAELDNQDALPRGWWGIDLGELLRRVIAEGGLDSGLEMPGFDQETMSTFSDMDFMDNFVSMERLPDIEIDGQTAAVFGTSIDLGALYSNPEFQTMLREQMEAGADAVESGNISDEEFEDMMALFGSLFEGFVVQMSQSIGLDDHYIHQMSMALDWSLDFGQILSGLGDSDSIASSSPINVNFNLLVELSQFNNAPMITAPDNVQMIPLDDLFDREEINDLF